MTKGREWGELNSVARNPRMVVIFLPEKARGRDEIATTGTKSLRFVDFLTAECIVKFALFRSSLSVAIPRLSITRGRGG